MGEATGFGFASGMDSVAESVPKAAGPDSASLKSMLHKASTQDLVKAGLESEFIGRVPVRVALNSLSEEDLFKILTEAEESASAQLVDDFRRYGIQLSFSESAYRAVAKRAVEEGTGARALVTVL